MEVTRNLIMDSREVDQRVNRIAYQIYEDNYQEKGIVIVGIRNKGYKLAEKIMASLQEICDLDVKLIALSIDKKNQVKGEVTIDADRKELAGRSVILVDDVLNSGKTLIYSMKALLDIDMKKIRTALLVDRDHKQFPISADFVGMNLSTTMQEHVTVEFGKYSRVYLS
jgi:pyrimidine operon attenuation protein/uracil phosphoribosyltransferase